MPAPTPKQAPSRIRIENPWPMIDCGRYPANLDEVKAIYVVGQHKDGYRVCVDVPMGAIVARRKKSQSGNVWAEWPLEMAQKTPEIAGAFVWKWFPTTELLPPRDFVVQSAAHKRLLTEIWRAEPHPSAAPGAVQESRTH